MSQDPSVPKSIVASSYNAIAERHAEWSRHVRVAERERYLGLVLERVPPGAELLILDVELARPQPSVWRSAFACPALTSRSAILSRLAKAGWHFSMGRGPEAGR